MAQEVAREVSSHGGGRVQLTVFLAHSQRQIWAVAGQRSAPRGQPALRDFRQRDPLTPGGVLHPRSGNVGSGLTPTKTAKEKGAREGFGLVC